jgi:hypothetical protein
MWKTRLFYTFVEVISEIIPGYPAASHSQPKVWLEGGFFVFGYRCSSQRGPPAVGVVMGIFIMFGFLCLFL